MLLFLQIGFSFAIAAVACAVLERIVLIAVTKIIICFKSSVVKNSSRFIHYSISICATYYFICIHLGYSVTDAKFKAQLLLDIHFVLCPHEIVHFFKMTDAQILNGVLLDVVVKYISLLLACVQ